MKTIELNTGAFCLVDDQDFVKYSKRSWHEMRHGRTSYARMGKWNGEKVRAFFIHRLIMRPQKGMSVDHVDGNGLNNQRSNLRLCTHAENCANRQANQGKRFKGVSWHVRSKTWEVYLASKNRKFRVGSFKDEILAAKAYNEMAQRVHGQFARLNIIP